MNNISNKAAIVGIGFSGFSKDSGKTELHMICECIKAALDDAGLVPPDIDGIVKHSDDATDEHSVTSSMGMGNLTYFGENRWNGAPCAMVLRAAIGVTTAAANYVVIYRAVNEASKRRMRGSSRNMAQLDTGDLLQWTYHAPFGLVSEAGRVAMIVRRYMHEYSINSDQFGWVTTVCREHGAKNPDGIFYGKPITMKDYLESRIIVDPIRELDCHEETDGAIALIITTAEKAEKLKQKPVYIRGATQSQVAGTEERKGFYRPAISDLPEMKHMGERLFAMAGVNPRDIKVAQLDDSFAPLVPMQLEELGFCDRGEGTAFCDGGNRIRVGGELPLNTSGGCLGEGHIYGMNHVLEAVRQIRGTSSAQVSDADLVLVASGAGGSTSGLILGGSR
ncbi:MAG: lipid-transfer protein [Dehalococcoidia bacterium]|nr:MAG: lipid-transfer protein [Dehalococcoidia bacterium]